MCGVPANAAPDMTGLGGKARMVTTSVAESSADSKNSDNKGDTDAAKAKNLLLEVIFLFIFCRFYFCSAHAAYEFLKPCIHVNAYLSIFLPAYFSLKL